MIATIGCLRCNASSKLITNSEIMKLITTIIAAISLAGSAFAADVNVDGYTRKDGTYVQPHHRTAPDNTIQNNYSTQGNVNPYTGQAGTVNPYQQPQQRAQPQQHYQQPQLNPYAPQPTQKPSNCLYGQLNC